MSDFTNNMDILKGKTGIVFWAIMFLIASIGFLYMIVFSSSGEGNPQMFGVAVAFAFMLLFSFTISSKQILTDKTSFSTTIASFWAGLIIWGAIAFRGVNTPQSLFSSFSVPSQALLSTASQQMPPIWDFFIVGIAGPIAEEFLFLFALPLLLFVILYSVIKNKFVLTGTVLIITTIAFRLFHVGYTGAFFTTLGIATMIFRSIQLGLFYGDQLFDVIPYINLVGSFALGAHIANNTVVYGLMNAFMLMISHPVGIVLLSILVIFAIVPIINLIEKFR